MNYDEKTVIISVVVFAIICIGIIVLFYWFFTYQIEKFCESQNGIVDINDYRNCFIQSEKGYYEKFKIIELEGKYILIKNG